MKSDCLTICAGFHPAKFDPHLEAWAKAGLLANVASCSLELVSQLSTRAPCHYVDSNSWESARLEEVIGRKRYEAITFVTLRTEGLSVAPGLFKYEGEAFGGFKDKFISEEVRLYGVTVGVADPSAEVISEAFSPVWDVHLLHDSRMLADVRRPYASVEAEDVPGLCALVAVCVGGSWAFSEAAWGKVDQIEGTTKPVRIVRPQLRVVLSEKLNVDPSDLVFTTPPWPEPSDIDTVRANPGVYPPMSFLPPLATKCGFDFHPPQVSEAPKTHHWWQRLGNRLRRAAKAAGLLFVPFVPPAERSDTEKALEFCEKLSPVEVEATVEALRLGGMPGLASGIRATPKTWTMIRQALYGLVDGSEMPEGVRRPPPMPDRESNVSLEGVSLIWPDPSVIAPPPDAEAFVVPPDYAATLGVETIDPVDTMLSRRFQQLLVAKEGGEKRGGGDDDNDSSLAKGGEGGSGSDSYNDSSLAKEYDSRPQSRLAGRWEKWQSQWRWTTLWRLGDHLAESIELAFSGFKSNRTLVSSKKEYETSRASRRIFRWTLVGAALVLIVGALAVVERHFGVLGNLFIWGDTTTSLLDLWLVVGFVCLAVAVLAFFGIRAAKDLLAYDDVEARRREHSEAALYCARELTRLHTAAMEFNDHQQVMRTMLYEPFGRAQKTKRSLAVDIPAQEVVPSSMIIGQARVPEDQLEALSVQERERALQQGWIMQQGWIVQAHAELTEQWSTYFGGRINGDFLPPDADNGMAGALCYRDVFNGEELPGPREHFRLSVVSDDALRRHAASLKLTKTFSHYESLTDRLEEVHVLRGPVLPSFSVREFLSMPSSALDSFDSSVFSPSASPNAHTHNPDESIEASVEPKLHLGDSEWPNVLLANWRMPVSEPIPPSHLAGWQPPPAIPAAPATVV